MGRNAQAFNGGAMFRARRWVPAFAGTTEDVQAKSDPVVPAKAGTQRL
jgi:hypothetical protein